MKNRVRLVSGLALALGMAGLVVIPVSASTFDDGTDTLTLEETAANGAGYEWGLSEADSNKFITSLNAGKKITLDKVTKESLIKNLTATQKFVDDAKAEGAAGEAKLNAFKAAMQKMSDLTLQGTEDFVIDDELVQKMKSVIVDNEMINPTKGIESLTLVFAGKNIDMTNLSDEGFDGLAAKVKFKLFNVNKLKITPHHAKKLFKMDKDNIDAGNGPILDPDDFEFVKPDMAALTAKKKEGQEKVKAEDTNDKLKEEVNKLKETLRKADEVLKDQYADESDRDGAIKAIDDAIKAVNAKKTALGVPNSGFQTAVIEASASDIAVAGVTAVIIGGAAVAFARKKR